MFSCLTGATKTQQKIKVISVRMRAARIAYSTLNQLKGWDYNWMKSATWAPKHKRSSQEEIKLIHKSKYLRLGSTYEQLWSCF